MRTALSIRRGAPGALVVPARSSRRVLAPTRYRQEAGGAPAPAAPDRQRGADEDQDDHPSLRLLRSAIPMSTLDRTEQALAEFCSTKPSAEAREQCLEVLRYYREKRDAAQRGCLFEIEQQQQSPSPPSSPSPPASPSAAAALTSSPACASLAQLERLMHETSYSGDPAHIFHVLAAQRAAESRQQHQGGSSPHCSSPAAEAARGTAAAADALRLRALRLFHLADADGDAKLDREEFLSAMRLMDAELSDAELGAVFSALDARCSLTAEQFVDAVTGESQLAAALAGASVDDEGGEEADEEGHVTHRGAAFLRRHVRRGQQQQHPSSSSSSSSSRPGSGGGNCEEGGPCDADVLRRVRHERPTWWSDAPGYLEMIS